jgi:hypothetical protein
MHSLSGVSYTVVYCACSTSLLLIRSTIYLNLLLLSMQWKCWKNIAPIPFLKLINSFDRKLINFLLLLDEPIRFRFRTDWPIGNAQEAKRNLNSYELINLRKWIHAIFYQHFHCIDSNMKWELSVLWHILNKYYICSCILNFVFR